MFNAHQILIAASLPIIYGTFGLILFTKYTSQSALSSSNRTYAEKMVGIKNIAVDTQHNFLDLRTSYRALIHKFFDRFN